MATLARRPEAYHRKVLAGTNRAGDQVASIHDRVICKQEGLDKRIQYDQHLRKSLLDHFFDHEATLEAVESGQAAERGDFLGGVYEARVRRNPDRIQVLLIREGNAAGHAVRITKGVTLSAGSSTLEIAYLLEGLPKDRAAPLRRGAEFRRPARRGRRPLLPRPEAEAASGSSAAGSICTTSRGWAWSTSGWGSTSA